MLTVNVRANEVIEQLTILEDTFNSKKLVTNNGVPFTLLLKIFVIVANVTKRHILITTGIPKANDQAERMNSIIMNAKTILSINIYYYVQHRKLASQSALSPNGYK